jgi:hypothetical protein
VSEPQTYDASEQELLIAVFAYMLWQCTRDGGKKRASGIKPPWWKDPAHEAGVFSHINKWKHREFKDADSGAHPMTHTGWRSLAIAYQEQFGKRDPRDVPEFRDFSDELLAAIRKLSD